MEKLNLFANGLQNKVNCKIYFTNLDEQKQKIQM